MTTDRLINVTYSLIPDGASTTSTASLSSSTLDWDTLAPDLHRQLPLRNLHWKSSTRSIRTIQTLNVKFRPLSAFETQHPLGLLERPYLHLLFVACDDNEVYRSTLRVQIREWLDNLVAKQHKQEWLIVHLASPRSAAAASTGAKFYQRKGSVVDKIRADFNTGKADRCVQVVQSAPGTQDPTAWADLTTKMKEGVITTFSANVLLYEEGVRKADSQRQLQGWQYSTFFLQKEALADCFESMNLLEDALIQYDELEASFFQSLKENHMTSISHIGGTTPGDDSLALITSTASTTSSKKDYRKLLASNEIGVFDFRTYLFGRQASMLLQLGRISEIAKRGAYFISTFTRTLREHQDKLGRNFVESWTYSACLNIVDECTKRIEHGPVDSTVIDSFMAVKAELLELARKQLDKIGILAGHLPLLHPFSMSLNESLRPLPSPSPSSSPATPTFPVHSQGDAISRPDLQEALRDQDAFDKLYVALTNRAIQAYSGVGRKRCALKLHASLAGLEDQRQHLPTAQKLYAPLPAHYVDRRWTKLEASLLSSCTRLQGALDLTRERLLSTLAWVRAGVETGSGRWELSGGGDGRETGEGETEKRRERRAKELMDEVYSLSATLTKDFAAIAFPTFAMRLASERGETAVGQDGLTVRLIIQSILPCTLVIDEVRLKFSTPEGEQIWFTSAGCALPQGETEVTLFCPTAVTTRLALELSQIRYSRIIFQYSHRPASPSSFPSRPTISFPRDPRALDVYMEVPRTINLDEPRQTLLCLSTGRNELVKVSMKITCPNPEISLDASVARIVSGPHYDLTIGADDAVHMEKLPSDATVQIRLPIFGNLVNPMIELAIVVEYYTTQRPTTRRTFRRTVDYFIGLPVAVNVQDYFRPEFLLSKFAVTTDGAQVVKIKSATLEGPEDIEIISCRNQNSPPVTLFPLQASHFLFKVERKPSASSNVLRFSISYCALQEELLARIQGVLTVCLASASEPLRAEKAWFTSCLLATIESSTNMYGYGITTQLDHLEFAEGRWRAALRTKFSGGELLEEAVSLLRNVFEAIRAGDVANMRDPWRTLTIPVELPSLSVLNLVRFEPAFLSSEVGQALTVKLLIQPIFSWATTAMPKAIPMTYDINASVDDWFISGLKKGEFDGEENVETEVLLTLVPLRPGSLFLPTVSIRPTQNAGEQWACETQHLNASVTVDILPIAERTTFLVDLGPVLNLVDVA